MNLEKEKIIYHLQGGYRRKRCCTYHFHQAQAGRMRWRLEQENRGMETVEACWILKRGCQLGKTHSSLVIYSNTPARASILRAGRKDIHTTLYVSRNGGGGDFYLNRQIPPENFPTRGGCFPLFLRGYRVQPSDSSLHGLAN